MRQARPGDLLVRPVPIIAGAVLALNDHVLKAEIGNTITGKLSDAAGLVFLPLLLLALLELGRAVRRKEWLTTYRDVTLAVILVGCLLVGAKLSVPVAHIFGDVGGVLRYPFRGKFDQVTITDDPTDLLMLPALAAATLEATTVIRRRKSAAHRRPCTDYREDSVR